MTHQLPSITDSVIQTLHGISAVCSWRLTPSLSGRLLHIQLYAQSVIVSVSWHFSTQSWFAIEAGITSSRGSSLFLLFFPPFSSEWLSSHRSQPLHLLPSKPQSRTSHSFDWIKAEISHSTFSLHLLWMALLSLVSAIAVIDVLLKVVFITCSVGVQYATATTLPEVKAKYESSGKLERSWISAPRNILKSISLTCPIHSWHCKSQA